MVRLAQLAQLVMGWVQVLALALAMVAGPPESQPKATQEVPGLEEDLKELEVVAQIPMELEELEPERRRIDQELEPGAELALG